MEQHPIPQNISSYQFRLVGDMTLKQFFELAGGVLVSLIFYSTPLIGIIKWPLVILSALLGIGMAFVPFEERPLESWILAFFKTIYSPTEFTWKESATPEKFFADEASSANTTAQATSQSLPPATQGPTSKLENAEGAFLSTLTGLFSGIKFPQQKQQQVSPAHPLPVEHRQFNIPVKTPVKISQPSTSAHLVVEEKPKSTNQTVQILPQKVNPVIAGDEIVSTKEAIFSIEAAPPNPPTSPNVVVGQVVDGARRIVEGAIIEIRDEYGRPIRALKSNKLGHFIAVTPIDNGKYSIMSEKDGYQFMPVNFEAKGEIIPPILVIGKVFNIVQTPTAESGSHVVTGDINQSQQLYAN